NLLGGLRHRKPDRGKRRGPLQFHAGAGTGRRVVGDGLGGGAYSRRAPPQDRHSGCFKFSHAPWPLELATLWAMKFMPSTPSATFGYRVSVPPAIWPAERFTMS